MGRVNVQIHHLKLALAAILLTSSLSGCVAVTAVSAIPGALYDVVSNQFSSEEVSFPYSMRATLAATQYSLQKMRLDIDILETQDDGGYGIAFTNKKLNGEITLREQTENLSTILIKVKTITRETSIEHAIIQLIESTLKKQSAMAHFQIGSYRILRAKPDTSAKQLGWYRPGSMLDASQSKTIGWLQVELPSGETGYLKGSIVPEKSSSVSSTKKKQNRQNEQNKQYYHNV